MTTPMGRASQASPVAKTPKAPKARPDKAQPTLLGTVSERAGFASTLMKWGRVHGRRGLPWQVKEAYAVWVSEIMLQQTQVETVKRYYEKFLAAFPTVSTLAAADEDDVLAAWAGLGYYRRAKFMHKAAKLVVANHGGLLPRSAEQLRALPGIGRSTAAAIASIAYGERAAIMDGNVVRVLARRWGFAQDVQGAGAQATLWLTAEDLVDRADPGLYTQSIMDVGATVCLPRAPACGRCPFASECVARASGSPAAWPVKGKAVKERRVDVELWRVWTDGRRVALKKNEEAAGVWQSMLVVARDDAALRSVPHAVVDQWAFKHIFSHYDLMAEVQVCKMAGDELDMWCERNGWLALTPAAAVKLAVPKPVKDVLVRLVGSGREGAVAQVGSAR